jgi:phosphoribosylaminoimidazolecarboxamide formyltransferase/IMP cyclohydrolase
MSETKKIKTALVSVFHKDGLDELLAQLHENGVQFLSTGGTQTFIESLGYPCQKVEDVTTYPSILGGRVKTLHPKVFGGILGRRELEGDREQMAQYEIPEIDLVIVDLYPFEQTVASGASDADIIEKIDIGGISLIRAGAKNFNDVVIVPSKAETASCLISSRLKAQKLHSSSARNLQLVHLVYQATTILLSTTGLRSS